MHESASIFSPNSYMLCVRIPKGSKELLSFETQTFPMNTEMVVRSSKLPSQKGNLNIDEKASLRETA